PGRRRPRGRFVPEEASGVVHPFVEWRKLPALPAGSQAEDPIDGILPKFQVVAGQSALVGPGTPLRVRAEGRGNRNSDGKEGPGHSSIAKDRSRRLRKKDC